MLHVEEREYSLVTARRDVICRRYITVINTRSDDTLPIVTIEQDVGAPASHTPGFIAIVVVVTPVGCYAAIVAARAWR